MISRICVVGQKKQFTIKELNQNLLEDEKNEEQTK